MRQTDTPSHPWIRAVVRRLVTPDWLGTPLARLAGPAAYLTAQRQDVVEQRFKSRCARYFAAHRVMDGPFSGLRYPDDRSHGSALYPKLLGTYEAELHPVLRLFRERSYSDLVDIGFAEGYYLVGLALWFPAATPWGFDISPRAHQLCAGLAAANEIPAGRLRLAGEATDSTLAPALNGRSLVICDCEGCEAALFASGRLQRWERSDLLIECHDFIEPGITETLRDRLAASHEITLVKSAGLQSKLALLPASARARFNTGELSRLVDEGRPAAQTWIIAFARTPHPSVP